MAEPPGAYRMAFTDWLACACAGAGERSARAVRCAGLAGEGLVEEVAFAATAGHALDYDDTLSDGVAHVSAATAPAALVLAAARGRSLGDALAAYAEGWEAMAAVAAASHPALYDRGWHPTAVCAPVGAAVVASALLELSRSERDHALAIAMLRAGGTRAAFGSDGKAIQVALAAAAGVQAALLAQAGATVNTRAIDGPGGFADVVGASWPADWRAADGGRLGAVPGSADAAITRNWIKLHPSCLGTHAPIDAVAQLHEHDGPLEVVVHPVARQAAHLDDVTDGLAAKFSIPYCVAHTLVRGAPTTADFARIDTTVRERATAVAVAVDPSLPQWGAVLRRHGHELVRMSGPRGAPGHPITAAQLRGKVRDLTGDRLAGVLDDLDVDAADVLAAAGLSRRLG